MDGMWAKLVAITFWKETKIGRQMGRRNMYIGMFKLPISCFKYISVWHAEHN